MRICSATLVMRNAYLAQVRRSVVQAGGALTASQIYFLPTPAQPRGIGCRIGPQNS